MARVAALLSGGVDSSVAVYLLKQQGITPDLFYIKIASDDSENWDCTEEEDWEMASLVAKKYGCKLDKEEMERVQERIRDKKAAANVTASEA